MAKIDDTDINFKDLFYEKISNIQMLIEYNDKNYNQRFDNITEVTKMALASADKATLKAEIATEKRLEGVNEWRRTYEDLTKGFITKSEFNARWEGIEKSRKDQTSLIFAILGLILSIVSLLTKLF